MWERWVRRTGALAVTVAALAGMGGRVEAGGSKDNFVRWRAQIREALALPKTLPGLDAKFWGSFAPMPGVVADRVTYTTANGMLVPAIVYRPETAKGKLPGIVLVSGEGGDKFSWYAVYSGMLFARMGAVVVTYDRLGEGERNERRESHTGAAGKPPETPGGMDAGRFEELWGQRLAGQELVDEAQAVALLQTRTDVDAKRIAVVGYGSGAFVAGLAGAVWSGKDVEPVRAVLLSGGGTFDDAADGGKSLDADGPGYVRTAWRSLLALGPEPDQRGAVVYALNAARGAMLIENGSQDTEVDIPHRGAEWFAQVKAKALALGGPEKTMFTTHTDEGVGHRTAWLERPGVAWLEDEIHFGDWKEFTRGDVARTPVTHVGQWVTENHEDIAEGAIREDREGGVIAVGTGFPGVQRAQLMVIPESAWLRMQGQLTYEGWEQKMVAEMK